MSLRSDPKKLREWMIDHLMYESSSGEMIYTKKTAQKTNAGDLVGNFNPQGYLSVQLMGEKFLVHRLVWLWHNGDWPTGEIDHIDRDKSNNRIENLRDVSSQQNAMNRNLSRTTSSGEPHIYINEERKMKFVVQFTRHNELVFFANVRTLREAIMIRDFWQEANRQHEGEVK